MHMILVRNVHLNASTSNLAQQYWQYFTSVSCIMFSVQRMQPLLQSAMPSTGRPADPEFGAEAA